MAGDRQVGHEEALAGRQAVNPREHPAHGGRLVHAEARVHVPADRAGVLGRVEALRGDDRVHAEIGKAAGVKQRRAIARRAEHARKRRRGGRHMRFGRDVERRVARLERREQALDALRIRGVRVIEHQRALGKRRQVRRRIVGRAVRAQVPRRRRLEHDEDDVAAGRRASQPAEIFSATALERAPAPVVCPPPARRCAGGSSR